MGEMITYDHLRESGHALRAALTSNLRHAFEDDVPLKVSVSESSWFDSLEKLTLRSEMILLRLHAAGHFPEAAPPEPEQQPGVGKRLYVNEEVPSMTSLCTHIYDLLLRVR